MINVPNRRIPIPFDMKTERSWEKSMAAKDNSILMINMALLLPAVKAGSSESDFNNRNSFDKKERSLPAFIVLI